MEYTYYNPKDVLFASNNKGKYDELYKDFEKVGINLIFDGNLDLEETTGILSENATQKARKAAKDKGMLALGDDSGVFVEALDYFPGVNSRRWFADEDDDQARNQKLLDLMAGETDRLVYLISRFSVVTPDGDLIAKASVKNEFTLADAESGSFGFGYDKILIPSKEMLDDYLRRTTSFDRYGADYIERATTVEKIEECHTTIGEMPQDLKNDITYRGRIAEDISKQLQEYEDTMKGDDS